MDGTLRHQPLQFSLTTLLIVVLTAALQLAVIARTGMLSSRYVVLLLALIGALYGTSALIVWMHQAVESLPHRGARFALMIAAHMLSGQLMIACSIGFPPFTFILWMLADAVAAGLLFRRGPGASLALAISLIGGTILATAGILMTIA
jgi:hypothetical protein